MNENEGITIVFIIGIIFGVFVGAIMGAALSEANYRIKAIENNAARYNPQTAQFEWLNYTKEATP